jgi:hypothetical protein
MYFGQFEFMTVLMVSTSSLKELSNRVLLQILVDHTVFFVRENRII